MLMLLRRHLQRLLQEVALGYAWIALLPSWQAGLGLLLLTWLDPAAAAMGLLAAISAWYAGQIAGADASERPVCVFNGLLSGLFVAHLWVLGLPVLALTLLGGVLCGWLTVVLGRLAWSLVKLPILSLPFALSAMLTLAAAASLANLQFRAYVAPPELVGGVVDAFLSAFGALYFMSNPWVGAVVLALLLLASRYYLLLAMLGYGAAHAWLQLLGAVPEHLAASAWDSNAILAALLVGGLFATPSLLTASLAVLAAVLAAWLALALGRILDGLHLAAFSVPFVLSSWLVLYAAVRNTRMTNSFNVLLPDFPERSYIRAQISRARVGEPGSVPLGLPFMGAWSVSQGFSGRYTHRGPWRHALDFMVIRAGKSFANQGNRLEDFYCYNLPVLSPAYGQVWRVVNDVPDNSPGTVNVAANWGNCVVIKLYEGRFALLAHLKPGSITVLPGSWVKPGDLLGHCGNSGRSPQPHLHMHVQTAEEPGSATAAFHLTSVMLTEPEQPARYELAVVPSEQAELSAVFEGYARPMYLLAGRGLRYSVACNEHIQRDWSLHCAVDALGRMTLVSSAGASCLAESTWAVFSCYERNAVADPFFDVWLLACGYLPASIHVQHWQDHCTAAAVLPHTRAKWMAKLLWPWASFASSEHQRRWDETAQAWQQDARHTQRLTGLSVSTRCRIVPQVGCTSITAQVGQASYALQATHIFQQADVGVPGWETGLG